MLPIRVAPKRRYLVRFNPKRVPHLFTDVLIIGAGITGIRAALAVDPKLQVVLATKDVISQSNSAYAQGGIAGVFDPVDNFANHVADTLAAGKGLCHRSIVETVVREAPERIRELITLGTVFDQTDGEMALTQEGGHSHRRVVHALGDATGKEVMRALIERVRREPHLDIWEKTFTIDLLTHEGECRGALVWNPEHGKTFVWAKQTILATGGAGRLFRETTNPEIATADGQAMAFRAGCEVRDMEFMSFIRRCSTSLVRHGTSSRKRCAVRAGCCATVTVAGSCRTTIRRRNSRRATSSAARSHARWRRRGITVSISM